MSQIHWSADWATGFPDIDEQHQQLIGQVNQMIQAREQNDSMQAMQALFDFMAGAVSHFEYEEEMLKEAGYKLLGARHTAHQNFTDKLIKYQERIFADLNIMDELLPQITVWLQRHIEMNDRAYVDIVSQSGIYQKNEQGEWVRPAPQVETNLFPDELKIDLTIQTVPQTVEVELNQVQESAATTEKDNTAPKQEDDAPRGWATGIF